jgi:adenosine deaminase
MDYREFLQRIPKIDLHCHLIGAVRASTLIELAAKNEIELPSYNEPADLYWEIFFFDAYPMICRTIKEFDDFRRITYEALEDAAATNVRYWEMFWSPQIHMAEGVPYEIAVDGVLEGIREAGTDFGIECRLIADIPRFTSPESGVELLETMLENPREEVIGIGSDFEYKGPPQKLFDAYQLAKKAGFHRCGHCGQSEPAGNIAYCMDVLDFERIDHGYSVILDYELTKRCAEEGIVFTICPTITQRGLFPWDLSKHPVREMINRGIRCTVGADDPAMIDSNLTKDMILMADHMGYQPEDFKQFILNGIDASWLDETTKGQWSADWSKEIDLLMSQIEGPPGLSYELDAENHTWKVQALDTPSEERKRLGKTFSD